MIGLSLYVHIPFCQSKCPYCDFNTYAGLGHLFDPLVAALEREILEAGQARGYPPARTVFLGGGTPTVLPAGALARILAACRQGFRVLPDAEISSEANPGTVDTQRFDALRQAGVNRLSIGVQSFDPAELQFLGRIHSAEQALAAFRAARSAGFHNINLDLIYGLPGHNPASWRRTLQQAVDLGPEHISLYALTIEEGTPFAAQIAAGDFPHPDPDLAADLYELADDLLSSAGYAQYEISNWARYHASFACQHNLTYWRNEAYLGFGPGAHSSESSRRWANIRPVPAYIERMHSAGSAGAASSSRPGKAVDWIEVIDRRLAMAETMLLGLRLVDEGVSLARFQRQHSQPLREVFGDEVAELQGMGLLEILPDRVRLTSQARLVANQVFARFLP